MSDSSYESSAYEPEPEPESEHEPETPTSPPDPSRARRARAAFRVWRRTRPFWGGLWIVLGGAEILFSEKAPLKLVVHIGLQGLAGYLLPAVMVLCGLLLWFSPAQRTFYAVLSVLVALGTWITSNLGGFLVGMILGLLGGSLAFGWSPRDPRDPRRRSGPAPEADPAGT